VSAGRYSKARGRRKGASLCTTAEIGLAVGAVPDSRKMAEHFAVDIRDGHFTFHRQNNRIAAEGKLDGFYVIRTSVPAEHLDASQTVPAYKRRTRLPPPQHGRSEHPADPPMGRGSGPRACLPAPAGLPCRMASADGAGVFAVP
jgi:hypothetical protein